MLRAALAAYTAALLLATPALAADLAERLEAAKSGDMDRLVVHEAPRERLESGFVDAEGNEVTLADFEGRPVFLNFWATWCPPCLKEMPSIDRLAEREAGGELAVLAVSADRGSIDKPKRWLEENGIDSLALHHDARQELAREAAVMGMPTTLLFDRQGREVARLIGEAEWDGPAAQAVLEALKEGGA